MLELIFESALGVGLVLILLVVFVYTLSRFFSISKPGPNPFKHDCTKPAKPLVTDQKARDKVIKQGFQAKLVPGQLDAIVIGSGIGGLTTAAILAKAGKKVLVLEQHDQAGGCCHTFIDKGYEFDVGIHYIGEMRHNTITRLLINQLTEGQLQWCDLIDEFDVVALGEPGKQQLYPFNAGGYDAFRKAVLSKFPKEEEAIDKYIALLKEVRRNMMGLMMVKVMPKWIVRLLIMTGLINLLTSYFKLARRTLREVLDSITDDMNLKAVLAYCWGDYGAPPSKGSFGLHAALINHFIYGGSYPRGGASEIAFHIIPIIESAGGRVLVRAPVTAILTDSDGKVTGVRVGRSSGPVDISAPLVISDAGVVNTFTKLLPAEVAKQSGIHQLISRRSVDSGLACMSLFVGLSGTCEELGIKPQNIWIYTSNDLDKLTEDYLSRTADEAANGEMPFMFVSFPSSKDPTFNERYPGKTVCTVITMANWDWFQQWKDERVMKRGEDYNAIKTAIARRMWEQVLAVYPQLAEKVDYFEVGSPITNSHYIAAPRGEIYGLDNNVQRFGSAEINMHLRPDTDIPGLLITGQDVLSAGFTGAMFGGLLCASAILQRNLYSDLVSLRKQLKKAH